MVSSISPKTGVRAGGAEVTITGANLAGATVDFGKKAGSIVSDTADKIVVTSPAGVGAVSVTVTTADGTSTASSADIHLHDADRAASPTFDSQRAQGEGVAGSAWAGNRLKALQTHHGLAISDFPTSVR